MTSVLVPLAEGFEELEAVTVIDLLRRAGFEVVSAGLKPGPVKASRRTVIVPDTTMDEAAAREWDMVVLPGGLPGASKMF
jgi:4-methyl-5(b-hydroxyethyl)-thiazole monophosphate biosynthesis